LFSRTLLLLSPQKGHKLSNRFVSSLNPFDSVIFFLHLPFLAGKISGKQNNCLQNCQSWQMETTRKSTHPSPSILLYI
jgi:hypothetical protein